MKSERRLSTPPELLDEEAPEAARSGVDGIELDIDRTIVGHLRGRSLAYVRALTLLKTIVSGSQRIDEVVAALERVWRPRSFHVYYDRPFLILAALRAEALASPNHPLARGLSTEDPDPLSVTRSALLEALSPARAGLWCALAARAPQTNEVSRAVAWKWPADLAGCSGRARPLGLVDVGASGGLNLIADRLPDEWEDKTGAPLRVASDLHVCLRVGFDTAPLDFKLDEDVAWARACLWPGDVRRTVRFDRAIAEWRASDRLAAPPAVERLNASIVPPRLPALLAKVPEEGLLIVYQTSVRAYMQKEKRERYEAGMMQWLAAVSPGRVAWIEMEATAHGASLAIVAHMPDGRGGVRSTRLGLTSAHPSVVEISAQGARDFAEWTGARGHRRAAQP
jgi:hypothetical protein